VKRISVVVVVVVVAASFTGCGRRNKERDDALKAVRATQLLARKVAFTQKASGVKMEVAGTIADDFRYSARLKVDGQPLLEEVYDDDALALRIVNGDRLTAALAASTAPSVTGDPAADSVLQRHGWVVDRSGAPPLQVTGRTGPVAGRDPVDEAFRYLQFVEKAIAESDGVVKYSPDSIDYKPSEDPFPRPGDKSGVDRYDLLRPRIPRPADQTQAGGTQGSNAPTERHYRKLSIYVRNGRVFRILEDTQFAERLKDTVGWVRASLKAQNVDARTRAAFDEAARSPDKAKFESELLRALNTANHITGEAAIRFRTVSVSFSDLGRPSQVALPTDAVPGRLTAFFGSGSNGATPGAPGIPGIPGIPGTPGVDETTTTAPAATEPPGISTTLPSG
jgi:hypothetical protein